MSDTGERTRDGPFQSRADGQLHFEPGTAANTFPVTAPEDPTPLSEDEPEGTVPASPLWAMKERAHEEPIHLFGHPARIRARAGEGDAAVYAIDDGPHHCMIGRRVGATGDGCVYSLIARVDLATWQALFHRVPRGSPGVPRGPRAGPERHRGDQRRVQRVRRRLVRGPRGHPRGVPAPRRPSSTFAADLPTADR